MPAAGGRDSLGGFSFPLRLTAGTAGRQPGGLASPTPRAGGGGLLRGLSGENCLIGARWLVFFPSPALGHPVRRRPVRAVEAPPAPRPRGGGPGSCHGGGRGRHGAGLLPPIHAMSALPPPSLGAPPGGCLYPWGPVLIGESAYPRVSRRGSPLIADASATRVPLVCRLFSPAFEIPAVGVFLRGPVGWVPFFRLLLGGLLGAVRTGSGRENFRVATGRVLLWSTLLAGRMERASFGGGPPFSQKILSVLGIRTALRPHFFFAAVVARPPPSLPQGWNWPARFSRGFGIRFLSFSSLAGFAHRGKRPKSCSPARWGSPFAPGKTSPRSEGSFPPLFFSVSGPPAPVQPLALRLFHSTPQRGDVHLRLNLQLPLFPRCHSRERERSPDGGQMFPPQWRCPSRLPGKPGGARLTWQAAG